jgi:DNA polymerase
VGPEITEEPSLEALAGIVARCKRCALAEKRKHVVFGEGASKIPLMLIGEGPGATEDDTGRPFVGKAGQLLTSMLEAIGLRREDIYITNIVKCRPPGNRDPKTDETSACRPFLDRQRQLLSPAVVVALGRPATQTLLESTAPLGQLRGRFHSFQKAQLLVTYHPAFLLRTPSMKAEAWKDLKILRARLEELKLVEPAGPPWWKEGAPS